MNFLKEFASFNDGYPFKIEEHSNRMFSKPTVIYSFINRDGLKFLVRFSKDRIWFREYDIQNGKLTEINTNDSYNIIKTVTNITIDFLKKQKVQHLQIDHLNSEKENKNRSINPTLNKRAILNSRYLKEQLPYEYQFEMIPGRNGTTTIIRLKNKN